MDGDKLNDAVTRWILAYDGTCGTCHQISTLVHRACANSLEVLPLSHSKVRGWRDTVLGENAPLAPTLLAVRHGDDDDVRAWTGASMATRLARRVGPRSALRIVVALGRLRREALGKESVLPEAPTGGITRARVLRLGAGALVVGGLIASGSIPAFAEQKRALAQAWVDANRDKLPTEYTAFSRYTLDYRKAIFAASSTAVRSQLWAQQFARYRATHPGLTAEQLAVIDAATTFVAKNFDTDQATVKATAKRIGQSAEHAFGLDEAKILVGALGPLSDTATPDAPNLPTCQCFGGDGDTFCPSGTDCGVSTPSPCAYTNAGCSYFWVQPCNGMCEQD